MGCCKTPFSVTNTSSTVTPLVTVNPTVEPLPVAVLVVYERTGDKLAFVIFFNDVDDETVHTSAVLRFPTFYKLNNYTGHNPKLLKTPYFIKKIENIFIPEMEIFSKSLIIPLGSAVQSVFSYIEEEKMKNFKYILSGFPHSSSLNVGSDKTFKKNIEFFKKVVSKWSNNV